MMSAHSSPWQRVTRAAPCPMCHRSDWCRIGERFVHCNRVQSDKPAENGGWYHAIGAEYPKPRMTEPERTFDVLPIFMRWKKRTEDRHLEQLSHLLGIEELPLRALNVAWAEEHSAWVFPMVNAERRVTGLRLRNERGEKWAVRGGKNGLFVPNNRPSLRCFICEGPTDTAALLSIGLFAIGRPSCNEGAALLCALLPALGIREVVIVADHDRDKHAADGRSYNPGVDGALALSHKMPVRNCIWLPATKDARDFVRSGGSAQQVENAVRGVRWNQPAMA